jgi:hypothetical protein
VIFVRRETQFDGIEIIAGNSQEFQMGFIVHRRASEPAQILFIIQLTVDQVLHLHPIFHRIFTDVVSLKNEPCREL